MGWEMASSICTPFEREPTGIRESYFRIMYSIRVVCQRRSEPADEEWNYAYRMRRRGTFTTSIQVFSYMGIGDILLLVTDQVQTYRLMCVKRRVRGRNVQSSAKGLGEVTDVRSKDLEL